MPLHRPLSLILAPRASSRKTLGDATPGRGHPPRRLLAGRATAFAAALVLGAVALPTGALAVEPLHQFDVVLLQPGAVIDQRVDGGADAMADYLKRLGDGAAEAVRANPQQIPSSGFIVVAVRPGGQAHAWFDFKPALADKTVEALTHVVETVTPTPVKSGDIVFALRVALWSDKPPEKYAPAPQAWRDAAKQAGHKIDLDALVDQTWPR